MMNSAFTVYTATSKLTAKAVIPSISRNVSDLYLLLLLLLLSSAFLYRSKQIYCYDAVDIGEN